MFLLVLVWTHTIMQYQSKIKWCCWGRPDYCRNTSWHKQIVQYPLHMGHLDRRFAQRGLTISSIGGTIYRMSFTRITLICLLHQVAGEKANISTWSSVQGLGFIKLIYVHNSLNYIAQSYLTNVIKTKILKINWKYCKIKHDKSWTSGGCLTNEQKAEVLPPHQQTRKVCDIQRHTSVELRSAFTLSRPVLTILWVRAFVSMLEEHPRSLLTSSTSVDDAALILLQSTMSMYVFMYMSMLSYSS